MGCVYSPTSDERMEHFPIGNSEELVLSGVLGKEAREGSNRNWVM